VTNNELRSRQRPGRHDQVPATCDAQPRTNAAAGNGHVTTNKYLRGAAGIGLGTTIKYLRRKRGNGRGTTF
jgi:hypothetical protein